MFPVSSLLNLSLITEARYLIRHFLLFFISVVEYGIERMNKEVSEWMKVPSKSDGTPKIPFIATRGYDSVVWNRLYSRDSPDFLDYKAEQAGLLNGNVYRKLSGKFQQI